MLGREQATQQAAPERPARTAPPPPPPPARRAEPVVETSPEPVVEASPEPVVEASPEPVVEASPEPVVEASPEPSSPPSFAALAALAASGDLGQARHADQSGTDRAAYEERLRAHGKDIVLAGDGLNTAEDGVQFLGPVDNESSRAAAAGLVLTIDQEECISCGTCVEQTEAVFFLGEDDKSGDEVKAEVLAQEGPMDLIQDAIDACPVTCIDWLGDDEIEEHHSAGGRAE
jgi:ferredoxin